jgi:sulfur-carrier protein
MIKILLFAGLKDRVGQSTLTWDKVPITVSNLKEELQKTPGLENFAGIMVAVNETYAQDEKVINDGDTVALIPPVSGG